MPHQQFPSHERTPLLHHNRPPATVKLRQYLRTEITTQWTDLILLFSYMITGLLDSSAVFIWGSFVSMQTGNTVYLGLGLTGLDSGDRWIKSAISIGSFCLGSFCFGTFYRLCYPRSRWALSLSFTLQLICVAIAASIATVKQHHKADNLTWTTAVPLALVAFQSSGQAVTSRVLNMSGLNTVVLTSVYCDLFSAPAMLALPRMEGWRRLGAVGGLLVGTMLGGLWAKSDIGLPGALWMAAACKGIIVVTWLAWKGK